MDVDVKFDNFMFNRGRSVRLVARWSLFRTYTQYSVAVYIRPEAVSDVVHGSCISLAVANKRVQFRDPCLNRSGKILPKAVTREICGRFSNFETCWPEVAGYVISGRAMEWVIADVIAMFGDSMLNSTHFNSVFNCILRRPEVDSDVISGVAIN